MAKKLSSGLVKRVNGCGALMNHSISRIPVNLTDEKVCDYLISSVSGKVVNSKI